MGIPVLVYGRSGAGKTYSLRNFPADELLLCSCLTKPLPFKGRYQYTYCPPSLAKAMEAARRAIEKHGIRSIVLDDAGYYMTRAFMEGHRDKRGSSQYELYNDIGDAYWHLLLAIMALPEDVIVYLIMHETTTDSGECRIRTIGRLLDEKVCLEGMSSVVLHAVTDSTGHHFRTQATAGDIAKSPDGMFLTQEIPNDLKFVDDAIRAYYDIPVHAEDRKEDAQ